MFDVPQTDFTLCEAINKAMVEANLCDPGAKGPTSRWGRLPAASNTKYTPVFKCRLHSFRPELRYTPDQIIDGLELVCGADKKVKPEKVTKAQLIDSRAEDVFVPRASENEVITALKAKGLYKRPLGGGKHDITCPWVTEHTGQIDHGTAYFEPDDLHPAGGFFCQHSHGQAKRLGALLEFLTVSFKSAKHKPTIRICAGEAHRIADAIEQELADSGRYYQSGGLITSVVTDPASGATSIKPLKLNALIRAMGRVAVWERYDSRLSAFVVTDPMQKHAAMLYDAERYDHLPPLIGLARQPFLRPDASVVAGAGFDPVSGFFGVFDSRDFSIPNNPTQAHAQAALGKLKALLTEFSFATQHDLGAALAAMLTAAARPSLELAPMFHVRAPLPGSGKSYLTSIIASFVSPAQVPSNAMPTQDEELRKMLMAELMAAPAAIVFDNLVSDLYPYPKLCSALTEEFLTDRILGVSKSVTVSTRVLFLSSGNNVGPVKDMPRRTVTINIDPQDENPITREFKQNPLAEVRQRRGHYVSLALTIIRAWHTAGRPYAKCKPYGSYGQWCDWIRQPLMWLGVADPVEKVFESMNQDPDKETLGRLMIAWRASFGRAPTLVREAIAQAPMSADLNEILREVAGEKNDINSRKLGNWISRHEKRIVGGLRFEKDTASTNAQRWIVKDALAKAAHESVMSVMSVCFGEAGQFGSQGKDDFASESVTTAETDLEVI